jgi:hypothetical protein
MEGCFYTAWVENRKVRPIDIERMQLVDIVRTLKVPAPFPPIGVWRSWERAEGSQRHSESLTGRRSPAWGVAECSVGERRSPCRVCLRAPRHEPRPATPHSPSSNATVPIAAKTPSVALNAIRLTSARFGSRATCSLRNASSSRITAKSSRAWSAWRRVSRRSDRHPSWAPNPASRPVREGCSAATIWSGRLQRPTRRMLGLQAVAEERERYSGTRKPRSWFGRTRVGLSRDRCPSAV